MTIYNKNGFILWLMGPTSSGKTTLAQALVPILREQGAPAVHIDGDEVRNLFANNLGFNSQDRLLVVNTIVAFARKIALAGMNVVVSALTANDDARKLVHQHCPNLIIGFVQCDLKECIKRDPKGLYRKAMKGEIDTLIGYHCEYNPPASPDLTINTKGNSVEFNVGEILRFLYCNNGHGPTRHII